MPRRQRDHRKEYRLRIERGRAKGLTKTQARGHPKAGEKSPKLTARERAVEDHRLQIALRGLPRDGASKRVSKASFSKAAKKAGIAPEKLRQVAIEKGILVKRGRRWVVRSDIHRRVLILSNARREIITVTTPEAASLVARHSDAVGRFIATGDKSVLKPFANAVVVDDAGNAHPLEVRPNAIYRLSFSGGPSFEQIYRIVV